MNKASSGNLETLLKDGGVVDSSPEADFSVSSIQDNWDCSTGACLESQEVI